ncbi:NUC189-domain-containing protein [Trichodelitschia bisporula]|uniref:NUC189-domain-containing protein n=1 Tax=Trichodelitschia bisporula TaxID=703511 RepID=A0A6G1I9D6_9PEZI|nr:NUC189-domain-containing protein [Trichodelitschia bisporula]
MVAPIAPRSRATATKPMSAHSAADAPPAKRPRRSKDTRENGLGDVLLKNGGKKLSAVTTNGVKQAKRMRVDDAHTVVSRPEGNGDVAMADAPEENVVVISSDSSDEESADEASDESNENEDTEKKQVEQNGVDDDEEMADGASSAKLAGDATKESDIREEPSFGEILRTHVAEPIDVEATFADAARETSALAQVPAKNTLAAPSAATLGTVLTQALRTNDRELLETCFGMNDLESVRSTIERLPSPLVGDLLRRLAERIHKRPGRAGNLMVWVQWSIVSHGGFLASQPQLVGQLSGLFRVIKERASGLQPLLTLKGKLDMLSAQLELRRAMESRALSRYQEEENPVIYVEGEDESSEDEEEALEKIEDAAYWKKAKRDHAGLDDEDEESEDLDADTLARFANGEVESEDSNSEDDDEDEDEDEAGFIDDEASEAEVTSDDDDMSEPEEEEQGESVVDTRPSKKSMVSSAFGRR